MNGARVIALVPAHNEQEGIRATIESLLAQTHRPDVLVISDKSTDNTVAIVKEMMSTDSRIRLLETAGNEHKKSGALNQGYRELGDELDNYRFVLVTDADTISASDLIERGLEEFSLNPKLGAVCSRAGVKIQQTHSLFAKILYHLQRVEYAEFDRSRIVQHRRIKVVHGMCALFSVDAIFAVMEKRIKQRKLDCLLYDVHNITEDYELTVCLKECGYEVVSGFGMKAWTEVPLGLGVLWRQRVRWLKGGLDTLWQHGWNKSTRRDILGAGFFWVMLTFQGILLGYALDALFLGNFHLNSSVLIIMGMMFVDCVYSLRYVQQLSKWDYLVRITFLPQLIYAWFTIAQQLYAYYLFLLKKEQAW
jgi:cellulose synthase/poly-beta-1,6-N-acetylglucosamine synthase-like glycosyltransferase